MARSFTYEKHVRDMFFIEIAGGGHKSCDFILARKSEKSTNRWRSYCKQNLTSPHYITHSTLME